MTREPSIAASATAQSYAAEALCGVPRLLSLLDREGYSATRGSFDREHWAWKFRDFPITMLQAGFYPLALLWRHALPGNIYHQNPQLLGWIHAAMRETLRRQHRNGAFDSVAPFSQDHGVSLAVVHYLIETCRALEGELPVSLRRDVEAAVARACRFAEATREDYAFISNHQALFALAWWNAAEFLRHAAYRQCAEQTVAGILQQQSRDGWYMEYGGPDPGYETLGIHYLSLYWQRTRSAELLASLRRSVEFLAHCVHPDGSIGGVYGSRQTVLYFPAGFVRLAEEILQAAGIADFMLRQLGRGNVLTVAQADPQNLVILLASYIEAALAASRPGSMALPPLPCESLEGPRRFEQAGLVFYGSRSYYAVASGSRGGVCRVFDRRARSVAYEDAGYLVRAGGKQWVSQGLGFSRAEGSAKAEEFSTTAQFSELVQEVATAPKFVLLRLLNLTVYRSARLAGWFTRQIVRRLILKRHGGPLRLQRRIVFAPDEARFSDRIELTRPVAVDRVGLPRSLTGVHMGSARYFHAAELESTPRVPVENLAAELNARGHAELQFVVRFPASGPAEMVRVSQDERTEARGVLEAVITR